ncbi:hypothetical protein D3C77_314860 [compost metagenome]
MSLNKSERIRIEPRISPSGLDDLCLRGWVGSGNSYRRAVLIYRAALNNCVDMVSVLDRLA